MAAFLNSKEFIEFCHKVFDHLPIPIDFLDKDGKLIYINKAFGDFLQKTPEEMVGRLVTEVNSTSRFLEVLRSKQAEIAWRHRFENGKDAIVHRIPILEDNGDVLGGFGVVLFENLEEMKEVMAAEKQAQKKLEEAFRGIGYGID
jgi:transcriptional regulator with PAS, ATPase and Fis domain